MKIKKNALINCLIFGGVFLHLHVQSNPAVMGALAKPCTAAMPNLSLEVIKNDSQWSLKRSFLTKIKKIFNAKIFVETGTYLGQTTREAGLVFDDVYSVELSTTLYQACISSLKNEKNIHLYQGDSPLFLKNLLPSLKDTGTIIFWLDAHHSMGITARGDKDTPIVEELQAIKESPVKDGIIMIDDLRYCYKKDCDYPPFTKMCELLLEINPHYKLALLGDVLMAFPPSDEATVSPVMWACMMSRLYDENNTLDINIKIIDRLIAQVQDTEFIAFKWLHDNLSEEEPKGLCHGSYTWWYGLALLHRGHYSQALAPLKIASHSDAKKNRLIFLASDGLKCTNTKPMFTLNSGSRELHV